MPTVIVPNHGQPTLGSFSFPDAITGKTMVVHTGFGAPMTAHAPFVRTAYGRPTLGFDIGGNDFLGAPRGSFRPMPTVIVPNHGRPTLGIDYLGGFMGVPTSWQTPVYQTAYGHPNLGIDFGGSVFLGAPTSWQPPVIQTAYGQPTLGAGWDFGAPVGHGRYRPVIYMGAQGSNTPFMIPAWAGGQGQVQ
jgi:hypothetical protein